MPEQTSPGTNAGAIILTIIGGAAILLIAKVFIATIIDHWVVSLIVVGIIALVAILFVNSSE